MTSERIARGSILAMVIAGLPVVIVDRIWDTTWLFPAYLVFCTLAVVVLALCAVFGSDFEP